jgi:hypothetical protein
MRRSFAQSVDLTCTHCQQQFSTEVWLIIDITERPDLVTQIEDETIHILRCPHCGTEHPLDAPLLLHDGPNKLLIFASQEQSTPDQDQQVARRLGENLIATIPLEERETYLTTAHTVVGIDGLRRALSGEFGESGDDLTLGLRALMEANSPAEIRVVAETHPVLLSPEGSRHLREYVRRLQTAGHDDLAQSLEHRVAALTPGQPHPTLQFIQSLLDAPSPEQRRALLTTQPQFVTPEVPTILEALADQAQRRHLDAVARDLLVIRDEVWGSLGRDVPVTPSA